MAAWQVERLVEDWAKRYVAPAFAGDSEAAFSLSVALGNDKRGGVAVAMWRAKVARPAYRVFLQSVWEHDHRHLISAAEGSRRRLRAMFRYAAFPVPPELPEVVPVWRGTSALTIHQALRGYSWTTDRAVACWFAMRFADKNDRPLVLRSEVKRAAIAMFTDERSEREVLLLNPPSAAIDGSEVEWRQSYESVERCRRASPLGAGSAIT